MQIYAKGMKSARLGEEYAQAVIIAESRLAEYSLLEKLEGTGDSGWENDKYNWEVSIDDYLDENPLEETPTWMLKQVRVVVTWGGAGKTRSVNLQTLKPVPAT